MNEKKKKLKNIFFYKSERKTKIYLYMCSSFIFVSVTGWPKEIQEGKEFIWLTIPSSEFLREVKAGTQARAERNG